MDRPITPIDEFERALDKAALTKEEYELIDYIRYTSVFTQPSLIKDLKRPSKPPHLITFVTSFKRFTPESTRDASIIRFVDFPGKFFSFIQKPT